MSALAPAEHTFTTVELFQFSAVSWHPHRIHFDQDYTRDVEGHRDLLVHGPLQAVHLSRYLREALGSAEIVAVDYRHRTPLYVGVPVVLEGEEQGPGDAPGTIAYEVWMRPRDAEERTTVCRIQVRTDGAPATG